MVLPISLDLELKDMLKTLWRFKKNAVDYRFDTLPIIDGMADINDTVFDFKLKEGYSAETSGGLLIMVPPEKVD